MCSTSSADTRSDGTSSESRASSSDRSQTRVLALADSLGVDRFPTHCKGKKVLEIDGKVSTYSGSIPSLSVSNLIELQLLILKIDKLAKTVPRGAPHEAPGAPGAS